VDLSYGLDDLGLGRPLQQVTAAPASSELKILSLSSYTVSIRNCVGAQRLELPDTLDAVHLRQVDVHEDNVRRLGGKVA